MGGNLTQTLLSLGPQVPFHRARNIHSSLPSCSALFHHFSIIYYLSTVCQSLLSTHQLSTYYYHLPILANIVYQYLK